MDRLFQGEICRMRKTAGKGILFTVSESKLALIASRREFGCEPLHVTDKIKRLKNRPHGLNIMQKTSLFFSAAAITLTLMASPASAATPTAAQNDATLTVKQQITEGINRYLYSIDKADPTLGKQLFYVSPETSFIHPRGHERGWSQIAENFYGTTMGKTFSKRTLKLDAPPAIHVYGNAAVAEFDWHFTAVRRDNGQTQHTTGRESQVWAKIPNIGWRIVHVHYSGPAKTGVGEGY
ncbi:membrane protein [Salmonella enterica subsp. houtenae serovar Houten]|nr:membrane protein [Salmonella enterica subsp. houtenae serovar Houten]